MLFLFVVSNYVLEFNLIVYNIFDMYYEDICVILKLKKYIILLICLKGYYICKVFDID